MKLMIRQNVLKWVEDVYTVEIDDKLFEQINEEDHTEYESIEDWFANTNAMESAEYICSEDGDWVEDRLDIDYEVDNEYLNAIKSQTFSYVKSKVKESAE